MVEINNQRKAFLDMLAWSEELITDVRKPEILSYDVIVGGELFTDYSSPPSQTCHAKPKTQINRRRTLPTSFPLVGCLPQATAWKTSPKSQDAVALQQIRAWRFTLWLKSMVVSVRQSTVAAISGLHCRALVMVSSSMKLTAWLQNSKKRAERSEKIDVWAESPRLSPLWLSASSSACHGLLIITVITPLPTKPSATKMPENWLANAAITDMQMRQRDVAALDAKYTKELADAKAENDALRDDVAAGRRQLHIKAVCQSVREATTASGVDNLYPDWQTPLNGIISPSERGWSLCKNNWKEPRSILMSSADRVCPYRWATHAIIVEQYTRASSGV